MEHDIVIINTNQFWPKECGSNLGHTFCC